MLRAQLTAAATAEVREAGAPRSSAEYHSEETTATLAATAVSATATCFCSHRCGRRATVLPRAVEQQHAREQLHLKALQLDDRREGQRRVAQQQQQQQQQHEMLHLAQTHIGSTGVSATKFTKITASRSTRFACRCSRCSHKFGATGRLLCESAWRDHWRVRIAEITRMWDEQRAPGVTAPAVSDRESGVAGGPIDAHEEEDTGSSGGRSCCDAARARGGDRMTRGNGNGGRNTGSHERLKSRALLLRALINQLAGRLMPAMAALRQRGGAMGGKRRLEVNTEAGVVDWGEVESPPLKRVKFELQESPGGSRPDTGAVGPPVRTSALID
ncbi:hypothetical protein CLOM_g2259 [Closterium sp. NIES-68]|nr:hypothetical protein CLOM_g2259 [Closterium sp. NIES-68]GJP84062.1 hypothetical protein CLOP_g14153 [Closterium sp. NIES-67]